MQNLSSRVTSIATHCWRLSRSELICTQFYWWWLWAKTHPITNCQVKQIVRVKLSGVQVRDTWLFYSEKNGNLLITTYSTRLMVLHRLRTSTTHIWIFQTLCVWERFVHRWPAERNRIPFQQTFLSNLQVPFKKMGGKHRSSNCPFDQPSIKQCIRTLQISSIHIMCVIL